MADVATGIFGSSAALAIVPTGSTNIAARSLGIPAHPTAALALLCGSYRVRSIDVGRSDEIAHSSTLRVLALTRRYFMRRALSETPPRLVRLSPSGGGGASAAAV